LLLQRTEKIEVKSQKKSAILVIALNFHQRRRMEETSRKRLRKAFDAKTLSSFFSLSTSFLLQCNQDFQEKYISYYK